MEESAKEPSHNAPDAIESEWLVRAQLEECRTQLEHWQGVATICELSKQEELAELQRHCDQEIQSLQEALRETASQYEARISMLQSERAQWRKATGPPSDIKSSRPKSKAVGGSVAVENEQSNSSETEEPLEGERDLEHPSSDTGDEAMGLMEGGDCETGLLIAEGYFSQHCDTASLSSFSLDTPSLPLRAAPQEDTASLLSTGTLVPEAIYLPPPGYRLVTHSDWDALHAQLAELQAEVTDLQEEKSSLEKELDTQTSETKRQVSTLQSQVKKSESLLQDLQKSFQQSQSTVQSRLAELSLSQRKVCSELSRMKGGEAERERSGNRPADISTVPQGAHCEERLRIEIVNLKEQLETRTEESEVLEVQLSSLKTEADRIQGEKEKLQQEFQASKTELTALRLALSHLQKDCKALINDKATLQQQCLELRSQVISLRSQLDTSQAVQRDFVQLSQSLQVKLELIRQAETMDEVREVLGEGIMDDGSKITDAT